MKGGASNNEKVCEFCGSKISLISYVLHTAQCKNKDNSQISNNSKNSFKDINEILFYSKDKQISPKNSHPYDNDFSDSSNIYNEFPMISNNQIKSDNNFKLLGNFENPYNIDNDLNLKDDINSILKLNSFKKVNNNFEGNCVDSQIWRDEILNQNKIEKLAESIYLPNIEKNNEVEINNFKSELKICPLCFKEFNDNIRYEMHVSHCNSEEDSQAWENFQNNNVINNYNIYSQNYDDHPIVEDDNSYYQSESQDLDNSNLNYEDLLELDENIVHPLPKDYVSMLEQENLTPAQFSKLNEENKKCMICFEDFEVNQKFVRLPCFHIFHVHEIFKWFERNKTCPVCRMDVEKMFKDEF